MLRRKFNLTITCTNAAFGETKKEKDAEVARILRELANQLTGPPPWPPLRDHNGRIVGDWYYTKR